MLFRSSGGVVIGGVGDVVVAYQGDLFRKRQDGAFFGGVKWRLAPGVEGVDALLAFSVLAGVAGVHVDAEGAAVDLGRPDIDQVFVGLFEAGMAEVVFQGNELAVTCGFCLFEF